MTDYLTARLEEHAGDTAGLQRQIDDDWAAARAGT